MSARLVEALKRIAGVESTSLALEYVQGIARAALAEAEAQPVQEPVAWPWRKNGHPWSLGMTFNSQVHATTTDTEVRPLYAAPPQPVPLTDEQIATLVVDYYRHADQHDMSPQSIVRAIERAHGIGGKP